MVCSYVSTLLSSGQYRRRKYIKKLSSKAYRLQFLFTENSTRVKMISWGKITAFFVAPECLVWRASQSLPRGWWRQEEPRCCWSYCGTSPTQGGSGRKEEKKNSEPRCPITGPAQLSVGPHKVPGNPPPPSLAPCLPRPCG